MPPTDCIAVRLFREVTVNLFQIYYLLLPEEPNTRSTPAVKL